MKNRPELGKSAVYFSNGSIAYASNDGMEILGHFLLCQVNEKSAFFVKWLEDLEGPSKNSIASGSYLLEKDGDLLTISHLEDEDVSPFTTSRQKMIEILNHWHGWCTSDTYSVCGVEKYDQSTCYDAAISYDVDKDTFNFHTFKK